MSHLTQLKTFVEVYRCKNITKAAANLGMSQPAVTAHIQTMEAVVGKALFERQARGVKPTPTAHDLALQVSGHIDILEQKITSIRARSNAVFGTLNIAGPAEYLSFVSGPQIANLLQAGNINVVLHIGNKINIFDALINDTADIAIAASAPDPTSFDYLVLDKEQLWLVMNRLEGREIQDSDITADLLSSYNVVTYDQDLPLVRQYFDRVFNAGCNSNVIAICPDIRAIANIIRSGIGYSVLPDYLCRDLIKAGELIQLGPVGPENNIYLVWKKGALKHPRIAFAKDVISAFANINYLSN
ncbi:MULTISPECIES: LysR family transcriptional regulator [Pseudoalteromonas]|uniref:LysR family transcriptional regulator n=1 Tax=Pseudoalteromonas TaxID=53246 RepID=UPI00029A3515|nr:MULTISPECIES: LysR family transcriptional regulator [Pseudoalteromonas]AUJ72565.1 HTH-type transcriptional regulator CysL [Pseudoalteromonas sp. NC201]MBR8844203.1 LysR family transcriptional regulator [Pseudoalteromonas sp. JC3]MCF2828030.1 LysR family transcriptional regulator [Pseudoalteromonas sp. OF5H-5]MCF2830340.1 LysR family transcriptional regulator [Pseudoalteromonas sp. DL2-H6]MCF2924187.1 LysR family transcriptional regulator [Pseudoalteromonas sp. DL2-H1]